MTPHDSSLNQVVVPAARLDGLTTTEADGDVILFDTQTNHIHHLNRTSAVIWRLCDGRRTISDLARLASDELASTVDIGVVRVALTKLDDAGLLESRLDARTRVPMRSRRKLLRQVAIVGGGVAVAELVSVTVANASVFTGDCLPEGYVCSTYGLPCCNSCNSDDSCT